VFFVLVSKRAVRFWLKKDIAEYILMNIFLGEFREASTLSPIGCPSLHHPQKRRIDMKLWIDDVRPAPEGYTRIRSVNAAKKYIEMRERDDRNPIELIDIDHNAGDYAHLGGDYIKLLDWLEETGRNYPIRIHSMNAVGVQNMIAIIQRNDWKEVF
jgi:hypothetical protein